MINLLPPEIKTTYRYGQRNTALLRWVMALGVGLLGIGLITTYGLLTIQRSTDQAGRTIAAGQAVLQREDLDGTEKQIKTISSNLKLATQVLSKEILFSKLLKQIATVIPANTSLKGLDINQTTGAIDITADASDYQTAAQVQVNLSDPANQIFSRADIVGINCSSTSNNPRYACSVQVRALFDAQNQFLFINNQAAKP